LPDWTKLTEQPIRLRPDPREGVHPGQTPRGIRCALALAAVTCALILFPDEARACTCAGPRPPADAYAEADAVFIGRVTSVSRLANMVGDEVTFSVSRSYSPRVSASSFTMYTGDHGVGCGYPFALGEEYVVYACDYGDARLWACECSNNAPVHMAAGDLQYLSSVAFAQAQRSSTGQPPPARLGSIADPNAAARVGASGRPAARSPSNEDGMGIRDYVLAKWPWVVQGTAAFVVIVGGACIPYVWRRRSAGARGP
jgi:hypothetical protein